MTLINRPSILQIRIQIRTQIQVVEKLDPLQRVREIILGALAVEVVRGVFVALAEAEVAHEAGGGVAEVGRDREGGGAGIAVVVKGGVDGGEGAVDAGAFGRERERGDGVGEVDTGFGQADLLDRVVRRRA